MGRTKITGEPYVMKLDEKELNRLQEIIFKTNNVLCRNFIRDFGISLRIVDAKAVDPLLKYSTGFKPSFEEATRNVTIAEGNAILQSSSSDAYGIINASPKTFILPAVDGVYKILLKYKEVNTEKGTVSIVNGTKNIVGVGTEFTKIFDRHRTIIIADKYYEVDSVTDDTNAILMSNFPDTTVDDVEFSVGGYFLNEPSAIDDKYIYYYDGFEIIATAGLRGTYEYWLAEITVSGSVITELVDRRERNIIRLWGTELDIVKMSYSKSYVQLDYETDVKPTEELFITNEGKLSTNDLGSSFPLFNKAIDTAPMIRISAIFQDRIVYVTRQPEILDDGKIRFGVCLSSQGVDMIEGTGVPYPMYFSFELVPFQSEGAITSQVAGTGEVQIFIKNDVIVVDTAISEDTAEEFITNSGKLIYDQNGRPFPSFTVVPLVVVNAVPKQDFDIRIVRNSEVLIGNNVKFKAYIGSVGVAPPDGEYKVSMMFIVF